MRMRLDACGMARTNCMMQSVALDVLPLGRGFGLRPRPLLYVSAAAAFFGIVCTMWSARLERFQLLRRADPAVPGVPVSS
jgi:hypothetical protein